MKSARRRHHGPLSRNCDSSTELQVRWEAKWNEHLSMRTESSAWNSGTVVLDESPSTVTQCATKIPLGEAVMKEQRRGVGPLTRRKAVLQQLVSELA